MINGHLGHSPRIPQALFTCTRVRAPAVDDHGLNRVSSLYDALIVEDRGSPHTVRRKHRCRTARAVGSDQRQI
jgi:hypothetical protein